MTADKERASIGCSGKGMVGTRWRLEERDGPIRDGPGQEHECPGLASAIDINEPAPTCARGDHIPPGESAASPCRPPQGGAPVSMPSRGASLECHFAHRKQRMFCTAGLLPALLWRQV